MRERGKLEQIFILIVSCIAIFGLFCLSSCGGESCEPFKAGCDSSDTSKIAGISIPGCGGCMTSGTGCGSCLYGQANILTCLLSCPNTDEENTTTEDEKEGLLLSCDKIYYGGCLGCGSDEKTAYLSIYFAKPAEAAVIYGLEDPSEEKLIGCAGGSCALCADSDGDIYNMIKYAEDIIGVR